jgi:aryl-alcohol dehydrogenase-like predicted oxidoreductase
MKLALGTVQFGGRYGAFNAVGRPALDEVARILDAAEAAGIGTLDTARAYGESEAVLGALRAADRFSIVTKVEPLGDAGADAIDRSIDASLDALRTDRIEALMLHAAADLLGPEGDANWKAMEWAAAGGRCGRIGVSVYRPDEAATIMSRYPIGIIQLPASLVDQRFARAGILDRCAERGVEVHARSVFLQGFLLADPDRLPPTLAPYRPVVERVIARAADRHVPRTALLLAPLLRDSRISKLLVGLDSRHQLDEILAATLSAGSVEGSCDLAVDDEMLLDPGKWAR